MTDGFAIDPLSYELDEIEAVETGVWKATVRMVLPETLDEIGVAHHVSTTVRFRYRTRTPSTSPRCEGQAEPDFTAKPPSMTSY